MREKMKYESLVVLWIIVVYGECHWEGMYDLANKSCGDTWITVATWDRAKTSTNHLLTLHFAEIMNVFFVENLPMQNLSYFDHEWSIEKVISSYRFASKKHSGYCSIVVTDVGISHNRVAELTTNLLWQKLARPHIDQFVHILKRRTDLIGWLESPFGSKFRFQNYIILQENLLLRSCVGHNRCDLDHLIAGKFFLASTTNTPERTRFWTNARGELIRGEGPNYNLLVTMSQVLNFTFSIIMGHGGGASGIKLQNGTWTGVVGDILYGRVAFGVMLAATDWRDGVIDFPTIIDMYARVFYVKNSRSGISWKAVFLPFSPLVWFLMVPTAALVAIVLYASVTYDSSLNIIFGWTDIFAAVIKILLDQDTRALSVRSWKIRLVLSLWTFVALLLDTAYRSKLVASLSYPSILKRLPTTLEELEQSNYKIFFRSYGGLAYNFMSKSTNPIHQRIFKKMLIFNDSGTCVEEALLNEHSACLDYVTGGDYAISRNTTLSSTQARSPFFRSDPTDASIRLTWAFPKGSPLTPYFHSVLLHAAAGDLFPHWVTADLNANKVKAAEWLKVQTQHPVKLELESIQSTNDKSKAISLQSFYGIAFLFAIGVAMASVGFAIEYTELLYRRQRYREDITSLTYY